MASRASIPQDLNWVEKRAACSARNVFNALVQGIENDVASINKTLLPSEDKFAATMLSSQNTLVIGRQGYDVGHPRVKVGIDKETIMAIDENIGSSISAKVFLNNEGRCVLRLEGEDSELEQWQFRKMALQRIFFGDGA